jgi:site-specific recombinase XerC
VTDAGLPYGRFVDDGVTFHTLRHTAATILAELEVSESKRKAETMGHRHMMTTQKYTHLRPMRSRPIVEALSAVLPISDLVTARRIARCELKAGQRRSAGLRANASIVPGQSERAGTFTTPSKAK